MAQKLYQGLKEIPGVVFTQKVESNALFLTMPLPLIQALQAKWFFYFWNEEKGELRLVTSFDTTEDDVEALLDTVRQAAH
jgi:threonine aldolase